MSDLRYAIRALRNNPGFTLVTTVLLALGIGANCVIFSALDAVLLRPLPVRQPEQFGSYVRGTGKKVELEYFRKRGRYVPWPECHDPPARTPSIEDLLIEEEFQALLRIELSKLALKEQRLVEWVFAERRDRHDIARDLGITSSGVNVRLWKIYEKLRAAFHKRSKIAQIEETRSPSAAQGYRSNQRCQNKKRPPNTKKRLKETL